MASFTSWLVGTSTTVALALGGWGLLGTVSNSERIAVVETEIKRLERIEDKIDALRDVLIGARQHRPAPRAEVLRPTPEPPQQPRRQPDNGAP